MKERYHITGMTCSACSSHVEKSVNKLDGVEKASVNLLTETMDVVYDDEVLGGGDIVDAVIKAGYGADIMESVPKAGSAGRSGGSLAAGSPNGSTAGSSERSSEGSPDDSAASVSGRLRAGTGSGGRTQAAGRDALQRRNEEEARAMKWRLGISIGFLVVLMYVAMYHMYNDWFGLPIPGFVMDAFHGNNNAMNFALTQLLLLLPILYMNRKFFAVGFKTLAHLSPNMDSLIALGASAATGYGIFAMYRISYGLGHGDMAIVEHYSHDLYFESAGMILTLITVGKYLESRSKGKTSQAITKLMDLSPKTAIVLNEAGEEEEIPTEYLAMGDVFLVKPGSLVPADGTVLEGNSSIDEAAITGESVPVEKQTGDKVVSATMNKSGFLKCRADRVGEDTTLSQIIRLVEEAGASKAPIAQLADKVAGVFVPVVIVIALVTLSGWLFAGAGAEFAISTAIAVLVISCPCALGLATPVAIMVGTGVGAGHGILIKSGEALQQAKGIDTVVLDKTGTITEGNLKVSQVLSLAGGLSEQELLILAGALERKSEHPLADAVVEAAQAAVTALNHRKGNGDNKGTGGNEEAGENKGTGENKGVGNQPEGAGWPQVTDFRAVFGRGIEGTVKPGRLHGGSSPAGKIYVGNRAYLLENGLEITKQDQNRIDRMADEGQTPLLVADSRGLLGIIGVSDRIKDSSLEAIQAWHEMGVRVIMLTGDNRRTAEAVRRRLNLEEVVAEVLPQDKEQKISQLKKEGRRVAMIGDGINDAPALAAADVGLAIGAGTDVAMESADIILMKSDLRDAVTAMRLSRSVIRNIKENLFWAFFYNSIGIPLAAGLLYPAFGLRLNPMFGAAAMSLSSIFVVGNALRLRGFKSRFGKSARKAGDDALLLKTAEETMEDIHEERKEVKSMTKTIRIEGMACGHCTGRVQKALEALEGVSQVTVSLEDKSAEVALAGEVADDALRAAVTDAGYEVTAIQ